MSRVNGSSKAASFLFPSPWFAKSTYSSKDLFCTSKLQEATTDVASMSTVANTSGRFGGQAKTVQDLRRILLSVNDCPVQFVKDWCTWYTRYQEREDPSDSSRKIASQNVETVLAEDLKGPVGRPKNSPGGDQSPVGEINLTHKLPGSCRRPRVAVSTGMPRCERGKERRRARGPRCSPYQDLFASLLGGRRGDGGGGGGRWASGLRGCLSPRYSRRANPVSLGPDR
ncbi:hypothetical protein WN51_13683 [Melipona quadrifasciata]|uniref:Uncharacterized protein n=1 Tax=Melipona quadrifasciata TaxID=166423 RepID=A0A0M9A029_9HYME|nr:hypothetical protein WN51_13683 [Melipona quadrifasciata]